jgi:cell division protein FtsA
MIAALDVGSSKVCCLIAHVHGDGAIRVVGIGHHASKGVKSGVIVELESARHSILTAVSAAEQLAGERIRDVIVNVSGGKLASHSFAVEVPLAGREVGETDLRRALTQVNGYEQSPDRELLHCIPVSYRLDATRGIRDPRGLYGEKLGIDLHLITARAGTMRNLGTCVEHCHLDVEAAVAAPYASGLACLVEDETDLGVTLVDMGGGTTTVAVFYDGEVIHTDSIAVGGQHVTSDIARGLSTPMAHAERMKTLYGSALPSPSDERELIDVPLVGEESHGQANHVPRSILVGIIRPRLEETLELVRSRLEMAGMDRVAGRRMVLTGGASQLNGVRELAALILEKQVRMGRPLKIGGLAESTSGPAFATCAGLLRYGVEKDLDARERAEPVPVGANGTFGRLSQWIRENF